MAIRRAKQPPKKSEHISNGATAHLVDALENTRHQIVELVGLLVEVLKRRRSHLTLVSDGFLHAFNMLDFVIQTGAVKALVSRLRVEKERIVLLDTVKALSLAGGEEALQALFLVYFDESSRFYDNRMKAHSAICRLTGKEFGLENTHEWLKYYQARFSPKTGAATGKKE